MTSDANTTHALLHYEPPNQGKGYLSYLLHCITTVQKWADFEAGWAPRVQHLARR